MTLPSRELRQTDPDNDSVPILRRWRAVVCEYVRRSLAYDTDRLPAIAGIASRFHSRLESNYLVGLWEVELPYNLSWYRRKLADSSAGANDIPLAMDNGVPTWSWASNYLECCWLWNNQYFVEARLLGGKGKERAEIELESHIQVTRIDCVPITSNAFGNVKKGS